MAAEVIAFAADFTKALSAEITAAGMTHAAPKVSRLLLAGLMGRVPYLAQRELQRLKKISGGAVDATKLKEVLKRKPYLAGQICCSGVYMPGSLLTFGWWERPKRKLQEIDWQGIPGIQRWLWNGFEQWAPSWDTNLWQQSDGSSVLLGQIGTHDEADSVPVIVEAGSKAKAIRQEMTALLLSSKRPVAKATIHGALWSDRELELHTRGPAKKLIKKLKALERLPKHCILVQNQDPAHKVELNIQAPIELYSGYLWKCVCPKERAGAANTTLMHSYFAWEHTNFADADAINYNLDALDHKIEYIARRNKLGGSSKDLVLLQHMMPENRLRGDPGATDYAKPEITTDEFMQLFSRASDAAK
jgi:hypothetical protein